ncbi:MAG: anti-sigma factor antagonist [Calditrichaeota bacterium]|nr:MAG: anti-sigma factor antagonist [Calditrichota bacterium]
MTVRKTENVTILKPITRRLDREGAIGCTNKLQSIIKSGIDRILLDLSEILYIDTRGLGFIIEAMEAVEGIGEISICCPNGRVHEFLQLTKMDNILRIFPNQTTALSTMAA